MIKKIIKILCICLGSIIFVLVGYISYIMIQYSRIEDNLSYKDSISNNQQEIIQVSNTYDVITYNIGFGAYTQDFSFFMDSGKMLDGSVVKGKYGKSFSKEDTLNNTNGVISILEEYNTDFMLLQEVDTKSSRSYKINQFALIKEKLSLHSSVHVSNFHTAYLFYPFNDPHGLSNSGIATFSKYQINDVIRKSLEVTDSLISKFFDLDRCFSITYIPTSDNKELVLINVHLSAYDEGGVYRKKQWKQLTDFMQNEYDKGNYIVCGGDFNHDIAGSLNYFETKQEVPEWVYVLSNDDLNDNFSFATSKNAPTCRSTDMPYEKGVNYTVVIDGFIVSKNIKVEKILNIDTDFKYSDHNPVYLEFSFN